MAFEDRSGDVIKQMRKLGRSALRGIVKEIVNDTLNNVDSENKAFMKKSLTYGANLDRYTGQPYGKVGYKVKKLILSRRKSIHGKLFVLNPSWVEFGTKPHTINVRRPGKKALVDSKKGTRFGKSVRHPGTKRNTPLSEAAQRIAPQALKLAEEQLRILSEDYDVLMRIPDDGNDEI